MTRCAKPMDNTRHATTVSQRSVLREEPYVGGFHTRRSSFPVVCGPRCAGTAPGQPRRPGGRWTGPGVATTSWTWAIHMGIGNRMTRVSVQLFELSLHPRNSRVMDQPAHRIMITRRRSSTSQGIPHERGKARTSCRPDRRAPDLLAKFGCRPTRMDSCGR